MLTLTQAHSYIILLEFLTPSVWQVVPFNNQHIYLLCH